LVINAHPDDSDFGASGTIAQWVKAGIEVAYVFCTNGDQGGEESGFTKEEMPAIRQREQRAAQEQGVEFNLGEFLSRRQG
jgi:LmbE family N-acetylglucosaminyl deacetylase